MPMRGLKATLIMGLLLFQFSARTADKTKNEDPLGGKDLASWIAQLDSRDSLQRMLAINALANIGPKADPAVQKLIDLALNDNKEFISLNARRALAAIGDAGFIAIIKKLETITEQDRPEPYACMLDHFGKAFSAKLLDHLKDKNSVVVRACINALANIEMRVSDPNPLAPPRSKILEAMKALLDHEDKHVRSAAKSVIDDFTRTKVNCFCMREWYR